MAAIAFQTAAAGTAAGQPLARRPRQFSRQLGAAGQPRPAWGTAAAANAAALPEACSSSQAPPLSHQLCSAAPLGQLWGLQRRGSQRWQHQQQQHAQRQRTRRQRRQAVTAGSLCQRCQ
jgi:hypothetical protein